MDDLFSHAENQSPAPAVEEPEVLTVSALSGRILRLLEDGIGQVTVEGEISGLRPAASGHVYFRLKDDKAVINAVLWRSQATRLKVRPEEGMAVVARGRVTAYGARSEYQITITSLEPAGQGALMQLLEERRQKFAAEGLFDEAHKKPLPLLPGRIGIVTSPTGAVIGDMCHRIADRCPRHILLWPVLVQGAEAARQIAAAINGFNRLPETLRPDVLIVARGGGSLEDLWAFNEEEVVRAVAASTIPVISGVGHEPDFTLTDFAADRRAPTPTAAAEMAVPVRTELLNYLEDSAHRMERQLRNHLRYGWERVELLQRALPAPMAQVRQATQKLDEMEIRLRNSLRTRLNNTNNYLNNIQQLLASYSPQGPLKRGYAYVTGTGGMVVRSARTSEHEVTLHFADGTREAALKPL